MSARRRWALITGVSAGGIGDAMAVAFLTRGMNVVATSLDSRDLDYLKPIAGSSDGFLVTIQMDVTDRASIASAVRQTDKLTDGKLDFLLNNAGYGYMMPLLDIDLDAAKKQYDVNVFGVIAVTQAFFPMLRAAKGTVVNQSSIGGMPCSYQPFTSTYTGSQAALTMISNSMRLELAPFGVNVVTLVTGFVSTEFWRNAQGARQGLPSNSIYAPIKDMVESVMRGKTNTRKGASRTEVAIQTVDELLSESPGIQIRRGHLAKIRLIINLLFPWWLVDLLYWREANLGTLSAVVSGDCSEDTMTL